jgi:hypothetical protein
MGLKSMMSRIQMLQWPYRTELLCLVLSSAKGLYLNSLIGILMTGQIN